MQAENEKLQKIISSQAEESERMRATIIRQAKVTELLSLTSAPIGAPYTQLGA